MPYKSDTPPCEVVQHKLHWSRVLLIAGGERLIWFTAGLFASPAVFKLFN